MTEYVTKLLVYIGLVSLSTGFCCPAYSDTRHEPVNKSNVTSELCKRGQNGSKEDGPVRFLSDVNAAIEAAGVRGGDYVGRTIREVHFDALRMWNWFFHFGIRETSLFDPSPSQLDHELRYLGIGHETANGRMSLMWDHTCHNPSRKLPENKRNDIHWNELGIAYETSGMMLGHKNDGIKFDSGAEWLNNTDWKASLSKIWMRTENDYEWMFKLSVRDDIFRRGNQVFYVHLGLNSICDDRGISLDPYLEMGDRIRLNENSYLTPFVSYEQFHDWYGLGQGEGFLSAGVCLEMRLDHESLNNWTSENKHIRRTPAFHISGGYASIINNEDYGHASNVAIGLDVLKLDPDKTVSLDTYGGILTRPHDLNPYSVQYKIGPTLAIDIDMLSLKMFYQYSCLYSLEDKSAGRNHNLLGIGLRNDEASYWNWNVEGGLYPSTKSFDYWGDLKASLDFSFRKERITPYVNCSGHYLRGNSSEFGHAIQAGLKIPGKAGSCSIYLCKQHDFDVFRFGKGTQTLLGIRFQF